MSNICIDYTSINTISETRISHSYENPPDDIDALLVLEDVSGYVVLEDSGNVTLE